MSEVDDQDPFEKTVTVTELPPLPVKALVNDLTAASAQWKMPGIEITGAKVVCVNRKYRTLIENSQRIAIRNNFKTMEYFEGWKIDGKMQIKEEGNYLVFYIYSRHT